MAKKETAGKPAAKTAASKKPAAKAEKTTAKPAAKAAAKREGKPDGKRRGRAPKLSAAIVTAMRKEYGKSANDRARRTANGNTTYGVLAAKYSVSRMTVRAAVLGTGAYAGI